MNHHEPAIAQLVERKTVDDCQLSLGHWFDSGSRDSLFTPPESTE